MKYSFVILVVLFGCAAKSHDTALKEIVEGYYANYQKRVDFDVFMDHYADNIHFEDIIHGDRVVGKDEVKEFFQWSNPDFKLLDTVALVIEDQIIDNHKVSTKGYFTPFEWSGVRYDAMYFTSILHFNKDLKIIKHVDWINYPNSLVDYAKRNDSNTWIEP